MLNQTIQNFLFVLLFQNFLQSQHFQQSQNFLRYQHFLRFLQSQMILKKHMLNQTIQMNPQIPKKYLLLRHLQIRPNHFLQLLFVQLKWLFC
tara:strand:- start:74 stop:349 length:276 start_codon:yes stop_codon:yes gene_type:complete